MKRIATIGLIATLACQPPQSSTYGKMEHDMGAGKVLLDYSDTTRAAWNDPERRRDRAIHCAIAMKDGRVTGIYTRDGTVRACVPPPSKLDTTKVKQLTPEMAGAMYAILAGTAEDSARVRDYFW